MGRYELLFRIAAGGMAEVYAARVLGEAGFQKLVALKRMLPTLADDEEFVAMFLDEARVAANISHPNVVQTLDLGRDHEGALYIVMELVVGVPLSRILKEAAKVRRAVPVGMAIELIAQAAAGLDAAHEAVTPVGEPLHIVHRDVSPQNVLVGVDGRVRITDFGVARAVMRMTKTVAGRIKGKFAYCAPEQLRSEDVDRRADIFALGVVAWEALAGQRLFVADHPLATMERVQSMPILPLDTVRNRVPKEVSEVVLWALDRDPEKRPATAQEFARALRRAAQGAGIELPGTSEIATFVKAAGGEPLSKMRNNIRVALSEPDAEVLEDSRGFELVTDDEPSESSASLTEGHQKSLVSHPEPDASGVSRVPGSLIPPEPEPKRSRLPMILGGVVVLAMAAGVGVAVALHSGPEMRVEPIEGPAPDFGVQPSEEPPQPEPQQIGSGEPTEPVEVEGPIETEPVEIAVQPMQPRTTTRMGARMTAQRPTEEPNVIPPAAMTEEPTTMRNVTAMTSVTSPSPMRDPGDTETPAMQPSGNGDDTSMTRPRMTLVGVDAFDMALGR